MLFNSIDFAVFLPIVFILYWFVFKKNLRQQNFLLLASSYVFYGWWDYRFLGLIFISTLIDFFVGKALAKETLLHKRKILLSISVIANLGFLGFFKYYNFFLDNFITAFSFFGQDISASSLNIILPVGISFYTFQTMSYTIDVYREKLPASKDFVVFSAYVSFFPQLVAGPIERATNLLPQFYKPRKFDYVQGVDGLRQILWGLFKKIVIADNCAIYANLIFNNSDDYSGSTLLLGAVFFAFQIYGDFSGYSDIAIGTAKLFNFRLMRNFAYPYFSRDMAEFWRRWHISLSTWFRDYLYIPLGGSRVSKGLMIRNTFIIFIVSGFWHGANWTFIVWGALNAIYFLPLLLRDKNRQNLDLVAENSTLPNFRELFQMLTTFGLTLIAWIFFRAENVSHAYSYIAGIISPSLFSIPNFPNLSSAAITISFILLLIVLEWKGRRSEYAILDFAERKPAILRYLFYFALIFIILWYGGNEQQFIYFQF